MHILVTDAHTPAALCAVRTLGEAGYPVTAMAEEGVPAPALLSRHCRKALVIPHGLQPSVYEELILERLYQLRRQGHDKPVWIPAGNRSLALVVARPERFLIEADWLGPDSETYAYARDKRRLEKAASALGLRTPRALTFESNEDIAQFAARQSFPLVLKYWGGDSLQLPPRRHVSVVRDARSLVRRYAQMHDVQSPVMVQEYIEGRPVCVGAVLDAESRPVSLYTYERLRGEPWLGTCYQTLPPSDITAAAVRLFAALGCRGFCMAEFLLPPGEEPVLIDLNFRLWRSFGLTRAAGLPMAESYVQAAVGLPLAVHDGRVPRDAVLKDPLPDLRSALRRRRLWPVLRELVRDARCEQVHTFLRDRDDKAPARLWWTLLRGAGKTPTV